MLASILNLPRRRKSSSTSTPGTPPPSCGAFGDACNGREEDGFVLVGESASERSTVMPVGMQQNGAGAASVAPPPSYAQITTAMPSLPPINADSNSHAVPLTAPPQYQNPMQQRTSGVVSTNTNSTTTDGVLNRSQNTDWAIVDLPFELSARLAQSNRPMSDYYVPQIQAVDWTKYDYDFQYERNVKRDSESALERMEEEEEGEDEDEDGDEEENNHEEELMTF